MFKWTRKAMVLVQHGETADAETKKRAYFVLFYLQSLPWVPGSTHP